MKSEKKDQIAGLTKNTGTNTWQKKNLAALFMVIRVHHIVRESRSQRAE